MQALDDLKILRSAEHIAHLKQEVEMHPAWSRHSKYLKLTLGNLSSFLDVDVPDGDWIFGFDRNQ